LISATLGRRIVKLLNTEIDISGITSGKIRAELRLIAKISRSDSEPLQSDSGDLEVNAKWGYRNQEGAIMPGRGKAIEREYTEKERSSIQLGSQLLGLSTSEVFVRLGETTYDVHLNENVIWQNVPSAVWHYTIGGYQAIKKWLSFREHKVLGRALSLDELREVTKITRHIAALLLLGPELDNNYSQIKHSTSSSHLDA
jgi:hypothetical protein